MQNKQDQFKLMQRIEAKPDDSQLLQLEDMAHLLRRGLFCPQGIWHFSPNFVFNINPSNFKAKQKYKCNTI